MHILSHNLEVVKEEMMVIGQLILVEGTKDNNIKELEDAVEEGVSAYKRKFPQAKQFLAFIHEKTRERWSVNGEVGGLEVYRDDAIPYPYVWVIDAKDRQSFSHKKAG